MVMAGAAAGGLARYVVSVAVTERFGGRFPLGTLVVNVSGCFLIGVLMTVLAGRFQLHPNWRLLLITGVLGGYTTYSSFAWETFQTVELGDRWMGFANVALSVIVGYLAVWFGVLISRQ